MPSQDDLKVAIADVYTAFAEYRFPTSLDAAPKHDVMKVLATLQSAPLVELPADRLGPFAGSVLYTIGTVNDYKHFLPRIFELSFRPEYLGLEPAAIANKLVYGQWLEWPLAERGAICHFLRTAWLVAREGDIDKFDAASFLCANCRLGENPATLLLDWLPFSSEHAVLQVASLASSILPDTSKAGFWTDVSEKARQDVISWIASDMVWRSLKDAESRLSDEHRWIVTRALELLVQH